MMRGVTISSEFIEVQKSARLSGVALHKTDIFPISPHIDEVHGF